MKEKCQDDPKFRVLFPENLRPQSWWHFNPPGLNTHRPSLNQTVPCVMYPLNTELKISLILAYNKDQAYRPALEGVRVWISPIISNVPHCTSVSSLIVSSIRGPGPGSVPSLSGLSAGMGWFVSSHLPVHSCVHLYAVHLHWPASMRGWDGLSQSGFGL